MKKFLLLVPIMIFGLSGFCQERDFKAGFMSISLVDSSRLWKPGTASTDSLHFRPIDIDIWYPSLEANGDPLPFGDLFGLFESRGIKYQGMGEGLMDELSIYFALELGLEIADGNKMLQSETKSYQDASPVENRFPVIVYMAGFNGMGYENYRILENLAQHGFVVVSVWSMGRYPGHMTNHKLGMLEQVYDAEFAIKTLKRNELPGMDWDKIGVVGCSWGGMSAAVLLDRNPEIKAFVSLDGSETHYFGESEIDDDFLKDIYAADLLHPDKTQAAYLYLESGNKWDGFEPVGEYNYFKKTNSRKHYLRFLKSKHEDFTSIPAMMDAYPHSNEMQNMLIKAVSLFFDLHIKDSGGFEAYYAQLAADQNTSTQPVEISYEIPDSFLFSGKIINAKSNEALPYVNLSILGRDIGTVSNTDGQFELTVKEEFLSDTIRISMIGYKTKDMVIQDIFGKSSPVTIALEEEISRLSEVVVTTKALKTRKLGNKTESRFVGTPFAFGQLGAEMGIKIPIRNQPTYLDSFNFNVSYNMLGAKALFRLNIYDLEKGEPGQNLLNRNIIIPLEIDQIGLISVDLKDYNIVLHDDVLVTLEWVDNIGETEVKKGAAVVFSLGFFTNGTYVKSTKDSKMRKMANLGVGFNLDVRY